ncbi:hypothetical protein [Campylobacter cuniculorum]|uniref:Uncharacterized protein n=2 Tax=Campylobacter cuniculorum TaxID=374106 RepID=A0A1W6BX32_9BACT|nr:hypothetical protein [Campylobacter cuniculorum]ARJ56642.1 hypothetical protein CCUN_1041 [Campylobacter cuniculorum DSM 23162 = LMG 24588]QOR04116.1 hypothetical protein A0071_08120 [Campylobacter cuniculorum]
MLKFLEDENFIKLMQKHCFNVLEMLMDKNIFFSIAVKTEFVDFDPVLPENLDIKKNPYAVFALAGYTFESIRLDKEKINFHAGFGPEDFATFVSVDLGAITHIQVENNVLFVNFSLYKREKSENLTQNSIDIFLNNPKNKNLFKK